MIASELRIGNLVLDEYGEIIVVSQIFSYNEGHIRCADDNAHDYDEIRPIPLTEEWLIKFGFEKDDDFGNWHLNEYDIFSYKNENGFTRAVCGIKENKVYYYFYASDDYYSWTQKLDHVHQLQNLYHAITGEELKIKAPTEKDK